MYVFCTREITVLLKTLIFTNIKKISRISKRVKANVCFSVQAKKLLKTMIFTNIIKMSPISKRVSAP